MPHAAILYGAGFLGRYYTVLEYATALLAFVILVLGTDDLFIDIWFWCREFYRRLVVTPRHEPLTAAQLYNRGEKPIAIMIPAWLEYDVIAPMLENMVATLDYQQYVIFVGTYVNDPETIQEVERIRRRIRQVVRVEVPHDGPTCKADCLNWLVQAIFLHEQTHGMQFAGVVLHDSEDVVHPLELRLFNYLLPRKDFIQIPVASLERRYREVVAGTYMDEFAEWHARDLVVRESLSGMVPSAGVGTCFSRHALVMLVAETNNQPFNTSTLTEDYDVGARLAQHGMKSIFCRFLVDYSVRRRAWFGLGRIREVHLRVPLCVREYFPDTFRTAYRQKARWTLGICFQGWQQVGWTGGLATRYLLFRDRKGMATPFVNIAGYLISGQLVAFWLASLGGWRMNGTPSIFAAYAWAAWLLYLNAALLLWRLSQRMYFVSRLYGWEHSLLSLPRMLVANFVNFMAAARAWRIFLSNRWFGTRIVWDKTMHDFPSASALARQRQRLGELLLAWKAVDTEHLTRALDQQRTSGAPLGRILIAGGVLDEETIAEAVAFQADLPRAHPDVEDLRCSAGLLPTAVCLRWQVVPFGTDARGWVKVASATPPSAKARDEVSRALSRGAAWFIVRETEIAAAMRLIRSPDLQVDATENATRVPLLGDLLLDLGLIRRTALEEAMQQYHPDRHGRIGDYLVAQGVVTRAAIESAVAAQDTRFAGAAPDGSEARR